MQKNLNKITTLKHKYKNDERIKKLNKKNFIKFRKTKYHYISKNHQIKKNFEKQTKLLLFVFDVFFVFYLFYIDVFFFFFLIFFV